MVIYKQIERKMMIPEKHFFTLFTQFIANDAGVGCTREFFEFIFSKMHVLSDIAGSPDSAVGVTRHDV